MEIKIGSNYKGRNPNHFSKISLYDFPPGRPNGTDENNFCINESDEGCKWYQECKQEKPQGCRFSLELPHGKICRFPWRQVQAARVEGKVGKCRMEDIPTNALPVSHPERIKREKNAIIYFSIKGEQKLCQ